MIPAIPPPIKIGNSIAIPTMDFVRQYLSSTLPLFLLGSLMIFHVLAMNCNYKSRSDNYRPLGHGTPGAPVLYGLEIHDVLTILQLTAVATNCKIAKTRRFVKNLPLRFVTCLERTSKPRLMSRVPGDCFDTAPPGLELLSAGPDGQRERKFTKDARPRKEPGRPGPLHSSP